MSMLIIKACGVRNEEKECSLIQQQAELYGVKTKLISPTNAEELRAGLITAEKYDYIYFSCHGDDYGLGNHDGSLEVTWLKFGGMLCDTDCMNEDCVLMLSCCRGGLNQVAYDLFFSCQYITYVVGPRRSLDSKDMQMCFSLLIYLMVEKNLDPVVACDKIRQSTDIRFFFSDRLEAQTEAGLWQRWNENGELVRMQIEYENRTKLKANDHESGKMIVSDI